MSTAERTRFVPLTSGTSTPKVHSESIYITKNIGNWSLTADISETGTLSLNAFLTLGKIGKNPRASESTINIRYESTPHLCPSLQSIRVGNSDEPNFCELDDQLGRTSASFLSEEKYYRRVYSKSSIITVEELFNELIPSFTELLKNHSLSNLVSKISSESANIQPPYNRAYIKEVN